MKVSFTSSKARLSLLTVLYSMGYTNAERKTAEQACKEVDHEYYSYLVINKDIKRASFNAGDADVKYCWPTNAEEIVGYLSRPEYKLKLNRSYEAVLNVEKETVQVGCQEISYDNVIALHALIVKARNEKKD